MIWPFAICILACIICGTVALTKRWVLNHEWQKAVMRNSKPGPERHLHRRQFMGQYEYDEQRYVREAAIKQTAIDIALSDMQVGLEKRITNLEKNLATHAHDYGRIGPPVRDFGEGQLDRVFREMGGIPHRW